MGEPFTDAFSGLDAAFLDMNISYAFARTQASVYGDDFMIFIGGFYMGHDPSEINRMNRIIQGPQDWDRKAQLAQQCAGQRPERISYEPVGAYAKY